MSVLNDGAAFLKAVIGLKVSRATATLPATTQAPIFNVTGGRVILTSLTGTVTTVTSATTNVLNVVGNPTAGTDVNLATAVSIASREVGGLITLPAIFGGNLNINNAGAGPFPIGSGVVLNPGTLDLLTTGTSTGSIKWDATYVPLDDGAAMTVA